MFKSCPGHKRVNMKTHPTGCVFIFRKQTALLSYSFVNRSDVSPMPNGETREVGQEVRKSGGLSQDLEQSLRKVYCLCKRIKNEVNLET